MKSLPLFCLICVSVLSLLSVFEYDCSKNAHADSIVNITVKFANDTSQSNVLSVIGGQKYTLSQEYSWVRDQTSRYNLQAYSVDNGPYVDIPRVARGNFTLDVPTDSNHIVTFLAAIQYPIEIIGTDSIKFVPPSPTGDNWFDVNSDERIIIPHIVPSMDKNTREQLKGWSFDGQDVLVISRQDTGEFTSTQIHMSNSHTVTFSYAPQYYLDLISGYGAVTGTGWYDSGSNVMINAVSKDDFLIRHVFSKWDGPVLDQNKSSTSVVMSNPIVATADWSLDYSPLVIVAIFMVAGIGFGIFLYEKRKPTQSHILSTKPVITVEAAKIEPDVTEHQIKPSGKISDDLYLKEIDRYILQKSLERLEKFESSGVLSKEKITKIRDSMSTNTSE